MPNPVVHFELGCVDPAAQLEIGLEFSNWLNITNRHRAETLKWSTVTIRLQYK